MASSRAMSEALRGAIERRETSMVELLAELVNQNSFTENVEGGRAVAHMLARELGSIPGVTVELVAADRCAPHVVASTSAAQLSTADMVVLVGHHDTVFPPGFFEGFRLDAGIARGPGVLDMKGGLVCMIEALRALAEVGALERLPLRFISVGDEEVGSPEGRAVIERFSAGANAALVFEAGRAADAIITARKGTAGVTATAFGRAAHAGNAHAQGANAIWALARFVDRAQALTDYARGVTVNVGKITGGHGKNTVPDRADAAIDFRYERIEDGEATMAALDVAAREAAASLAGTSLVLAGGIARKPLERTDANVGLAREYAASAVEFGLGDGEAPLLGGGSDASTTAAMGIASIDGLGPRGSGFHTKDELIEVATLVPKALALASFLVRRSS